jgi:uncharacterized membrane protein
MRTVGPLVLVAFLVWVVSRTRSRNASMFAASYAVAVLIFFSTSKQAFANYYFLIGHGLLTAVVALPGSRIAVDE